MCGQYILTHLLLHLQNPYNLIMLYFEKKHTFVFISKNVSLDNDKHNKLNVIFFRIADCLVPDIKNQNKSIRVRSILNEKNYFSIFCDKEAC